MSIDPIELELEQYAEPWVAYGRRRASRWKKITNAEVAANLDVSAVTQKLEAYNKRGWIAKLAVRLFTKIEREHDLLVYRLGSDLFKVLKASPTAATLQAQRMDVNKICMAMPYSPNSWFNKPLVALMSWIGNKTEGLYTWSQVIQDARERRETLSKENIRLKLEHERLTVEENRLIAKLAKWKEKIARQDAVLNEKNPAKQAVKREEYYKDYKSNDEHVKPSSNSSALFATGASSTARCQQFSVANKDDAVRSVVLGH